MLRVFGCIVILLLVSACEVREQRPITQMDLDAVQFPSERTQALVQQFLPFAVENNRRMQAHALVVGKPLNEEWQELARELGVERPERVRVVVVPRIPKANTANRVISMTPQMNLGATIAGITAGYGIYLDDDFADKVWVLAHELVHVGQFEEYGLEGLTRRVLTEQIALPGRLIPVEREAINLSARVLGIDPQPYAF